MVKEDDIGGSLLQGSRKLKVILNNMRLAEALKINKADRTAKRLAGTKLNAEDYFVDTMFVNTEADKIAEKSKGKSDNSNERFNETILL